MRRFGRILLTVVGFLALLVISTRGLWQIRHAYYEPKKQAAMRFCESLIPMIEAARQREGKYPATLDPKWLEGRRIPDLVRAQDFYIADGKRYLLRIRNPGDFWDNIWGYHGEGGTGSWRNYDGY
jgi:hypothetical protein